MSFQILKYDPNDHRLEEALSLPHGIKVNDQEIIQRIIGLYLNWVNRSKLEIFIDKNKKSGRRGEISIDHEERSLSQLFLHTPNAIEKSKPEFIFARLQVFEKCYDFELKVLDTFEENQGTTYITELPSTLSAVKERKIPRLTLNEDAETYLVCNNIKYKLTVIGPQSAIVEGLIPEETTHFSINNFLFEGISKKTSTNKTLIIPNLDSDTCYGLYFNAYASVAFPGLAPISSIPNDARFDLYEKAGYFNIFSDDDLDHLKRNILEAWDSLKNCQHTHVVDFVAKINDEAIGCSSLAKAFYENDVEVWVFHQLCALKSDENLEVTKELYRWRAEYISGKKEDVVTRFWFRSSSRWLERIYVKFGLAKGTDVLTPVVLTSYQSTSSNLNPEMILKTDSKTGRSIINSSDTFGGFGPEYLNASRLLNMVYTDKKETGDQLEHIARSCNQAYMVTCQPMITHVATPSTLPSDRMAKMQKDDMIDFIACLEHSIAVTIKKRRGVSEKE